MSGAEKKPALCKRCPAPTRKCDTCSRAGCPHLVSPVAKGSADDICGGCRLRAHAAKKKATPPAPPAEGAS